MSTKYSQHIVIPMGEFLETVKAMPCTPGECWVYPVDPKARVSVLTGDWSETVPGMRALRRFAYYWFTGEWPPLVPPEASRPSVNTCGTRKCINPDHADYGDY